LRTARPPFYFGKGNAKIGRETLTFSLPAGHTCPMAHQCLAKAHRRTGKLKDGPDQKFRCFSASAEAAFPTVRKTRWRNLTACLRLLKNGGPEKLGQSLAQAVGPAKEVRVHVAGDFFNLDYLEAWIIAAARCPDTVFYAYTKSLSLWVGRQSDQEKTPWPANLRLTASLGGKEDELAALHDLPTAQVVFHPMEAKKQGLEIDHDDSHAKSPIRHSFALLLHGAQKKGSEASAAVQQMKAEKIPFGYGKTYAKAA
jgi:hypothetical protein